MRKYGLESEKPVSNLATNRPHRMSQRVFDGLKEAALGRGQETHPHASDMEPDVLLGVVTSDLGEQGVDNAYNLQETALICQASLNTLAELAECDLRAVQSELANESATVINMSNHPLGATDRTTYRQLVAPKSLYEYLWFRGWDHTAGIDAKAQNSPSTSVSAHEAADAVSTVIGTGSAMIGIFGNSPFAEGQPTGLKESRLNIWDRMMRNSVVEGDRLTAQYPPHRFRTMAEYFNWLFGGKTGIHFVLSEGNDYKSLGDRIMIVGGNPSVLEYLSKPNWQAKHLKHLLVGQEAPASLVVPDISHMQTMQFAQFAGARIRFELNAEGFPLKQFLAACAQPSKRGVEDIFEKYATNLYIEGRDAGSNFPDEEIAEAGHDIARSALMAPSAIQAGLIRNLGEAKKLVDKHDWLMLGQLRRAAIKDGLQGEADGLSVLRFAEEVLEVASRGLHQDEQWMLAYPRWVLATGKNGADRAIEYVERRRQSGNAIADLVASRKVVL